MHPRPWPAVCLLLIAASALVGWLGSGGALAPDALVWQRDDWPHAPWTWWTAPLWHRVAAHALANSLALGALAVLGAALGARPRDALALLLAWPLGTLALALAPEVGTYYGLSGTVHAAAAVLALRALRGPEARALGLLLGGGLLIKLALERGWAVPIAFDSGWGFNVVHAAHLSGALAGVAMGALTEGLARLADRRPAQS